MRGLCPSGAVVAQPTCNRQVSGFESPLGLTSFGWCDLKNTIFAKEGWESG